MKKIIAAAVAAILFVSSTFALDFSIGGRLFGGKNLDTTGTFKENVGELKLQKDSPFDYGFGVNTNFTLFKSLGIQAELNLVKGSTSWNTIKDNEKQATTYDIWTLDIPLMAWLKFDLWKFTLGFGAGVNFSLDLPSGNFKESFANTKASFKENAYRTGFVAGADFKFYFTKRLGLVLDARYVMDFKKKEAPVNLDGLDLPVKKTTVEYTRKSFYGGLGLEFKFF